jgi:hypothetical protein
MHRERRILPTPDETLAAASFAAGTRQELPLPLANEHYEPSSPRQMGNTINQEIFEIHSRLAA